MSSHKVDPIPINHRWSVCVHGTQTSTRPEYRITTQLNITKPYTEVVKYIIYFILTAKESVITSSAIRLYPKYIHWHHDLVILYFPHDITNSSMAIKRHPDSKVHGAITGPIWDRQGPGGPHVGPMNFATWTVLTHRPRISFHSV